MPGIHPLERRWSGMNKTKVRLEELLLKYFCLTLLGEETNAIVALMRPDNLSEHQLENRRMDLTRKNINQKKEEVKKELEKTLHRKVSDIAITMQEYLTEYNVAYDEDEEIYYVIPKFMDLKEEKYQVQLGRFMSIYEACEYLNHKKRRELF